MQLSIDPSDHPESNSDWRDNISVKQAHPLFGLGQAGIAAHYTRAWLWSRQAEKVALALAESATDPSIIEAATRIAKRHSGVWRAANKMVRKDATGKLIRAVAAVRSDAGDATCPTWLEREANKRASIMLPIMAACQQQGYTLYQAATDVITREAATALANVLSDRAYRVATRLHGIDMLIVPAARDGIGAVNGVKLHILIATDDNNITPELPGIGKFARVYVPDSFYFLPVTACTSMSLEEWIYAQIYRSAHGLHSRNRITCGIFYGKQAEEVVAAAAAKIEQTLSDASALAHIALRDKINLALALADEAAKAGDASVAHQAVRMAQAYAEDAPSIFPGHPILHVAFRMLAQFDLSGLDDLQPLMQTHNELLAKLWKLPPIRKAELDPWTVIEHVKINSPADIVALAKWMREET